MIVNGQELNPREHELRSLADLIAFYNLDPQQVAVERNGSIPERETWEATLLEPDDRIELIRFVGGG